MSTTPAGSAETNLPQTGPSAFDDHRPPDRDLLDDCVHCGFCLPTCPTYQLWGEEMDSPRGRIYLINLAEKGEIGLDGPFTEHIDACLGCMACVTACPSGRAVRQAARGGAPADRAQRRAHARGPGVPRGDLRAVPVQAAAAGGGPARGALPEAARGCRRSAGSPRSCPGGWGRWSRCCRRCRCARRSRGCRSARPAVGARRATVALLTGCVQDVFFHRVNEATARVLAAEGCDVARPAGPAVLRGAGAARRARGRRAGPGPAHHRPVRGPRRRRRRTRLVVTNVAGCGSSMKDYGAPARRRPGVGGSGRRRSARRSATSTRCSTRCGPRAPRHPVRARVAYHDACHLGHAQGVRAQPRAVLRTIPELEVVDIPEAALCCGSAGIYNMVAPEPAAELGARKAANIRAVQPDVVVTANPGCLLQIGKHLAATGAADGGTPDGRRAGGDTGPWTGAGLPLLHPVQLLDASIRGVPVPRT